MSYVPGCRGITLIVMSSMMALNVMWRAIASPSLLSQAIPPNPASNSSPPSQEQPPFELEDFSFWSDQCLSLEQPQQYTAVLAACERAIILKPNADNLEIWTARSNALFELRRYADAVVSYRRVLTVQPQNSFALTQQCAALFRLGNFKDAIATCENALEINGDWGTTTPANAWYYRGLAFTSSDRWQDALDSFNRARAINPNDLLVQAERCRSLAAVAEHREEDPCGLTAAVTYYERALATHPSDYLPWLRQGIVLMQLKQEQRALTSFEQVIQIKADASLALTYRCAILNNLNRYEQALVACNAALQGDNSWDAEGSAFAWSQQSHALIGLNQYDAALEAANRATDIHPDYAEAWNNQGVSYWLLGQYDRAIAALKTAVTINPQYTQAWYNLGRAYSSLMRYRDAIQFYCQALYQPNETPSYCSEIPLLSRSPMQPVEDLVQSDILVNLGAAIWQHKTNETDAPNALAIIQVALDLNQNSFVAQYNQGLILETYGQTENLRKALISYQSANCIYPQQPQVLTGMGRVLEAQGKLQEALNITETVLSIDPQYGPALSLLQSVLTGIATQDLPDSQSPADQVAQILNHCPPDMPAEAVD